MHHNKIFSGALLLAMSLISTHSRAMEKEETTECAVLSSRIVNFNVTMRNINKYHELTIHGLVLENHPNIMQQIGEKMHPKVSFGGFPSYSDINYCRFDGCNLLIMTDEKIRKYIFDRTTPYASPHLSITLSPLKRR